jgi:hypothetical protein
MRSIVLNEVVEKVRKSLEVWRIIEMTVVFQGCGKWDCASGAQLKEIL